MGRTSEAARGVAVAMGEAIGASSREGTPQGGPSGSEIPRSLRMETSLRALAICWLISGIAIGLRYHDMKLGMLFLMWSFPLCALGWVVVGLPVIALDGRILRVPKLLLAGAGAVAGLLVLLLPALVMLWMMQGPGQQVGVDRAYLIRSATLAATMGSSATVLYGVLLGSAVRERAAKEQAAMEKHARGGSPL